MWRAHLLVATAAPWLAGAAPSPAPTPLAVTVAGTVITSTVDNARKSDHFKLVVAEKGTVLVSVQPIAGPAPRAVLKNDQGLTIRRADKSGQTWSRPPAGTILILEVSQRGEDASTYQLSVAFNVDRPPAERANRRPARPRETIILETTPDIQHLEHVTVDRLPTEYVVMGGQLLVTIPAYAQHGHIDITYDAAPARAVDVELIGTEDAAHDVVTDGCAPPSTGCIQVQLAPSVGTAWLGALARVIDADVARHVVATGTVDLKLRMTSSLGFTLAKLKMMPGIVEAHALGAPSE